jgi:curved DNA-binding protein CbpA
MGNQQQRQPADLYGLGAQRHPADLYGLGAQRMRQLREARAVVGPHNPQDLRKKYKQRALQLHPDRGGDPEQFKRLGGALQTLTNATVHQRRAAHKHQHSQQARRASAARQHEGRLLYEAVRNGPGGRTTGLPNHIRLVGRTQRATARTKHLPFDRRVHLLETYYPQDVAKAPCHQWVGLSDEQFGRRSAQHLDRRQAQRKPRQQPDQQWQILQQSPQDQDWQVID